jgi:hypothetical protein
LVFLRDGHAEQSRSGVIEAAHLAAVTNPDRESGSLLRAVLPAPDSAIFRLPIAEVHQERELKAKIVRD